MKKAYTQPTLTCMILTQQDVIACSLTYDDNGGSAQGYDFNTYFGNK